MEINPAPTRPKKLFALSGVLAALLLFCLVFNLPVSTWLSANISTTELNILDNVKPELTQQTANAEVFIQKDSDTLTTTSTKFDSEIPKGSDEALVMAN
ncbi:MAG: hypothetical protein WCV72_04865, partial [Patescibacteria group bacterium]